MYIVYYIYRIVLAMVLRAMQLQKQNGDFRTLPHGPLEYMQVIYLLTFDNNSSIALIFPISEHYIATPPDISFWPFLTRKKQSVVKNGDDDEDIYRFMAHKIGKRGKNGTRFMLLPLTDALDAHRGLKMEKNNDF